MRQKNTSNKVLGTIKLSMSEELREIAKMRASVYFSGNISAYVSHLILQDYEKNLGNKTTNTSGVLNTVENSTVNLKNSKIKSKTKK